MHSSKFSTGSIAITIPVLILLVLLEGGVLLPSKQVCVTPGCSEGIFSTLVYKYECAIYICTIYLRKKFQTHNYVVYFSVIEVFFNLTGVLVGSWFVFTYNTFQARLVFGGMVGDGVEV